MRGHRARERSGGAGMHDMETRHYSPGLGRFLGVDPLSTSFPAYTPYHYVHGDPVNAIDPTGMSADTLRVSGSASAVQGFNDVVSRGTGGHYASNVDANGNVTLTPTGNGTPSRAEQAFADEINGAVNDQGTTELELVDHNDASSSGVVIGDNGGYSGSPNAGRHVVDVGDVAAVGSGGVVTEQSVLSHEVAEARAMQTGGQTGSQAHNGAARNAEARVTGHGVGMSQFQGSNGRGNITVPVTRGFNNVQVVTIRVKGGQVVGTSNNKP